MRTTITAATAAILIALTGCSSSPTKADLAACEKAMAKQLDDAMTNGTKGSRPEACEGVDDKTLKRLSGEVLTERLEGDATADEIQRNLDDLKDEIDGTMDDYEQ